MDPDYSRIRDSLLKTGMLPDDPYLYGRLRSEISRDDPMHAMLGPLSHRAYVREAVGETPALAVPFAAAIPAYAGAKHIAKIARQRPVQTAMMPGGMLAHYLLNLMGLHQARSPGSWDEIFAGYEGMFSGLHDRLTK